MKDKKITKSDIITTDIVYVLFSIVLAACFIAIAFVARLIAVCGAIYLVKSFLLINKFKAFAFTLMIILSDLVFIYVDYVIFKSVKHSIKKYLKDRKEYLSNLE